MPMKQFVAVPTEHDQVPVFLAADPLIGVVMHCERSFDVANLAASFRPCNRPQPGLLPFLRLEIDRVG